MSGSREHQVLGQAMEWVMVLEPRHDRRIGWRRGSGGWGCWQGGLSTDGGFNDGGLGVRVAMAMVRAGNDVATCGGHDDGDEGVRMQRGKRVQGEKWEKRESVCVRE